MYFPKWSLFLRLPLYITKSGFYVIKILTIDAVMPRYKSTAIPKAKDRLPIFR